MIMIVINICLHTVVVVVVMDHLSRFFVYRKRVVGGDDQSPFFDSLG